MLRITYVHHRISLVLLKKAGQAEDIVAPWVISHVVVQQWRVVHCLDLFDLLKSKLFTLELPPNMGFLPFLFRKLTLNSFLVRSAVEFFNELVCSFALIV